MELQLYYNNSNNKVLNKKITLINTLEFNLKIDNSILQPVLILKNYSEGNYCYIKELKRYYYISDIKMLNGGLYQLQLDIDVLMTYKNDIMTNPITTHKIVKIVNDVDFNALYNFKQYLLMIGG